MKYLKEILLNIIEDLRSLRLQLLIMAYVYNFFVLYLVAWKNVNYLLSVTSIGLLTCCYAFWFASKHQENLNQNNDDAQ